jgi:diguanylate cyclase (GGDEF)-like protein/PAS domain S-box-containing protein
MDDALSRAGLVKARDFLGRLILLMLLFVSLLLIGYAELNHREFLNHHRELAEKATEGASRLISLYLDGKYRDLSLFSSEHLRLINDLAEHSMNAESYRRLQDKVAEYFPDYLAFTVATNEGEVLVDDFNGYIEEVCVNDIRGFYKGRRAPPVFIHPNPLAYHFDIMVRWGELNGKGGIFFVSFRPQRLARILADSELSEHRMMIVHRDIPGLIELTPEGSRLDLQREFILSAQELSRIIYTRPIINTRWELVDIPSVKLLESHRNSVRLRVFIIFIVFLSVTLYMAHLIRREERGRSLAEEALLESHHQLEHRVQQRTRELNEKNVRLIREVSQRRKAQEALATSEERYALAVHGSNDGIWDWHAKSNQLYLSPRCHVILGEQQPLEVNAKALLERVHSDHQTLIKKIFEKVVKGESEQLYHEFRLRYSTGVYRWYLVRGAVVRDGKGRVSRMAGSLADITKRKHAEAELLRDALHDKLTGLPNRTLFKDRLCQAVRSAERHKDFHFAVLYLDLDGFKRVNDSYGHSSGDSLLIEVAERIGLLIRKEDTLSRLSGDEFAILLTKMKELDDARVFAQRVLKQLEYAFLIEDQEVYVSCSIGIALNSVKGQDADSLLRDADIAMYRAKGKGRGCYEVFDEQLRRDIVHRVSLETELRHAIDKNEIRVYFQPIVSLKSGLISGFEALVRWQHPRRGLIEPREFIPIAEESKLIFPLGTYVLREACLQIRSCNQQPVVTGKSPFLNVNLSARQLLQSDLMTDVETILDEIEYDSNGLGLSLEITETAVMENLSLATEVLFQLKAMGIGICVDDFGTGHSSLSYLQNLPITTLKIDQSLVARMEIEGKSAEIVRTIISLARNLGIRVVAEGVENNVQLLRLRELQCDYGQGYLFSKPKGLQSMEQLLLSQPAW